MTVTVTTRKTTPAIGNSSNKAWSFSFRVSSADDIVPYLIDSDGVMVEITTDFAVYLNPDQETSPGGNVLYPVVASAITSDYYVQVVRSTPKTQNLTLTHGGNFSDENVMDALDRMELQIQEVSEAVNRALRLRLADTSGASPLVPTLVANYFLAANSAGTSLTWSQAVDAAAVTISSYIENNILNLANGAEVLAEIGGISLTDNNVFAGKNDFQSTVAFQRGSNLTVADVAAGVLTFPDDGNYYEFTDGTDFGEIDTLGGNANITVHFSAGGNTLTHTGGQLDLIGKADIITAADDVAVFTEYAAGNWRMISYARASGASVSSPELDVIPRDKYRDLVVTRPSAASVTVTAEELILGHVTTGVPHRATSVSVTPDVTAAGANGLDTGAEGADRWYYIWVIYNPTTDSVDGLLSESPTAPTMPSGYTFKALVGAVWNDSTPDFVDFNQVDNVVAYAAIQTIQNGSLTTSAWTGIDVTSFFPATARKVRVIGCDSQYSGLALNADGGGADLRVSDAWSSAITFGSLIISSNTVHTHEVQYADTLYYIIFNASGAYYATGWEY